MGNRESLIAGAKQCLHDIGYTRTTARDIATAAGVSLAAIGYHFGSTRELLNQALMEALAEWGAELDTSLPATDGSAEAVWTAVIDVGARRSARSGPPSSSWPARSTGSRRSTTSWSPGNARAARNWPGGAGADGEQARLLGGLHRPDRRPSSG